MTSYNHTFTQLVAAGEGVIYATGDSINHTFIITVAAVNTSVDYNFQYSLDGTVWIDFESADVQKTGNGSFAYTYSNTPCNMIRPSFRAEAGGTAVTLDVVYKGQ